MTYKYSPRLSTCRFCKDYSADGRGMVKYGTRHYAHFKCYLDAGKTLDRLHPRQIGEFPFFLLKERNLLGEVRKLLGEV